MEVLGPPEGSHLFSISRRSGYFRLDGSVTSNKTCNLSGPQCPLPKARKFKWMNSVV